MLTEAYGQLKNSRRLQVVGGHSKRTESRIQGILNVHDIADKLQMCHLCWYTWGTN